jgi:hypothetical protein
VLDIVETQRPAGDGEQRFGEKLLATAVLGWVVRERTLCRRVVEVDPERQPFLVRIEGSREGVAIEGSKFVDVGGCGLVVSDREEKLLGEGHWLRSHGHKLGDRPYQGLPAMRRLVTAGGS